MPYLLDVIFSCDLNKLRALLPDKRKINEEITGTDGCTPLHLVVGIENSYGKDQVLSYLLEMGADPNARSNEDLTPVHIATIWNHCSELEKLLIYGGNPWLTDNEKKNCFDLATDNHSYEAYQLLNRYLSEDKIYYRNGLSKTKSFNRSTNSFNVNLTASESVNANFRTANENFPVYFSSSDEDSASMYLNVSKILKRTILTIQSPEKKSRNPMQRAQSPADLEPDNLNKLKMCNFPDLEAKLAKFKDEHQKLRARKNVAFCYSDCTGDSQNLSSSKFSNSEMDASEDVILDTDNESGIMLVAKSPIDSMSVSSDSCHSTSTDWKACKPGSVSSVSNESSCATHSYSHDEVLPVLNGLTNQQIMSELQKLGDNPGPVLDSTRQVYLKRLMRLKSGCMVVCPLPQPKYCEEVYLFLEGKLDKEAIRNLMNYMTEDFCDTDPQRKWREGDQRCCFNYFLLDPRVTQNLPERARDLSFNKLFFTFLDALFYVGKGTRSRPYSHLIEAVKAVGDKTKGNDKINHILDIWNSGMGVVSLHCFRQCIPAEAYTHEACIIEAIGLDNLTNMKKGDYYGIATKWKRSLKCQIGISLLHKALQIFLAEGERQIAIKDICNTRS